jgi:hypothetical protein
MHVLTKRTSTLFWNLIENIFDAGRRDQVHRMLQLEHIVHDDSTDRVNFPDLFPFLRHPPLSSADKGTLEF